MFENLYLDSSALRVGRKELVDVVCLVVVRFLVGVVGQPVINRIDRVSRIHDKRQNTLGFGGVAFTEPEPEVTGLQNRTVGLFEPHVGAHGIGIEVDHLIESLRPEEDDAVHALSEGRLVQKATSGTDSCLAPTAVVTTMSVAAETRAAVRERPFLETALRAGVVNYTAAARFLDVGDDEAVAAALRRYAEELDDYDQPNRRVSVSMKSGVGPTDADDNALLSVGGTRFTADGGDFTAVVAEGEVDAAALVEVLGRLRTADVAVEAAAGTNGTLAVVVGRRDGADAVRAIEGALS